MKLSSLGVIFLLLASFGVMAQVNVLSICDPGEPIQLETFQGAYAYSWMPGNSLDNPTIYNPIGRPNEPTTYVVQIIPAVASSNLVINGDFSAGNEGFTSDYPYVDAISQQGVYGINTSAQNLNAIFFADCPDRTDGSGNMMVVDGSPLANEVVWCQTIDIQANKSYAFSSWLTSVNPQNPARLQFSINGSPLGSTFVAGSAVCEWRQFYQIWESETNTTAEICIINQNTNPTGNDFALDDFAFYELDSIIYDTFYVEIESLIAARERRVFIPNAFSPNEDGFNDWFEINTGKGIDEVGFLKVFDRWGNLVFQKENCRSDHCAWDGLINGRLANEGTYIYATQVTFSDGTAELYSGSLELLR